MLASRRSQGGDYCSGSRRRVIGSLTLNAPATGHERGNEMRILPVDNDSDAPIYNRYPGQIWPQDAYIEIDCEDQTICAESDPEIGGAVPERVWNNRAQRIEVTKYLSAWAVNELLDSLAPLAERVIAGFSAEWRNGNYRGEYDADAFSALDEIRRVCAATGADIDVMEADDFLEPLSADDLRIRVAECGSVLATAEDYVGSAVPDKIVIDGGIDAVIEIIEQRISSAAGESAS